MARLGAAVALTGPALLHCAQRPVLPPAAASRPPAPPAGTVAAPPFLRPRPGPPPPSAALAVAPLVAPAPPPSPLASAPPSSVASSGRPPLAEIPEQRRNVPGVLNLVAPFAPDGAPTVALTFDDGPDPRWTPGVLRVLGAEGVRATFCVVGALSRRFPALVRAVHAQGHVLCDHTEHHVEYLNRREPAVIEEEVVGGAEAVASVVGAPPPWYRPPGGTLSYEVVDVANAHGMAVLGWSVDSQDYRRGQTAEAIRGRILRLVHPGAVVLMHDGGGDRSATLGQLADLIRRLRALGYVFVVPTSAS